ncbi:MAG: GGDEF domain-containing protein [Candidatus Eremiobacteraeota bacterium]|nr:GGDEF domain-containing protein [Candidatus Eremiobacteraeota bacterium]
MKEIFESIKNHIDKLRTMSMKNDMPGLPAIIGDIEKEIETINSRMNRETRLSAIERAIYTSSHSIDETMDQIANLIKDEFEFSRFDIVIIDQELGRVMRRYSKGGFGEADLEKLARHGALGVTRDYALEHMEPWIVNDIKEQDPKWKLARELDVWVHGTFPLYYKKKSGEMELQGLIHGARTKKSFLSGKLLDEKQINELKRLGFAINKAIHDARLAYFEHGIMKIQNIIGSTRMEIMQETDEPDTETTQNQMDFILDAIINIVSASIGGIIIRENDLVIPITLRNDSNESIPVENFTISSRPLTGLVSGALFDGYSIIENEVVKNGDRMDIEIKGLDDEIHTLMAIPLIESYSAEGKVRKTSIGVVILVNKKDPDNRLIKTDFEGNEGGFSSLDRRSIESISPHIETIISNTKSHKKLHLLSLTDGMTGLANHSHFMNNLLTLEFKRSKRYGTPLSVLLLDIDHFKVFNDIFGHQVGDLVLKESAKAIKANTREVDHIARYGGEEFAVILHNTPLDDAISYAEKVRKIVNQTDFTEKINEYRLFNIIEANKRFHAILEIDDRDIRNAKIAVMKNHFNLNIFKVVELLNSNGLKEAEKMILDSIKVTISAGLAFYPDTRISSKRDLVTTADMLLLKAKERGRNRIEVVALD